ncbi:MAG: betaine/proline/choline family ABC transporter ATP-binding protein [Aminobacterium sp.]|uniref:betaine/proline/choline family ABC transporter ATP-binding protein n=1 Tax=unclassified Aminobacterium TaxID=2685012 RepID=UPI001BD0B3EF|nr:MULTISPECIES: betaine/proline/choline family ABC transporter ATP-binding protein [unclassified Aminobacterium]MDD2206310.1 betaine/proline/choline family ABC transporter ATP-binding protein [Aminobacterium sp.]MDD3426115.1 betaine/proline/choline family ABC transporter ATP-binding protein [Aminobacterium sp.]MDD3707315.1 betaine/proline/choline family ABC transporter ATP-binding protein [Aminobacterium sp.]MDD4228327.1 betaine/proline/choline family ABC transporter ATP-binding protein [Amino
MNSISKKKKILEIHDLWKVYTKTDIDIDVENEDIITELDESDDAVVAVRGVSLTARQGEVFVIMGLSGSGKSTLIRCILRLIEPTSGEIWVNGQEVTSLSQKGLTEFRRKQIAMVFQHYGLLPHKTVINNVEFGLKLQGIPEKERRARSKISLERVGLKGWENYYPGSLSGGMRQRVGIARALVMDTPILLMDEPFSGLDPLIRREMQDELIRLQKELKKTIFFVTHDLDEAMRMGDRMAVMKNGSIVQMGAPAQILANPADEYVARFVQDKRRQIQMADEGAFISDDESIDEIPDEGVMNHISRNV